MYQQGRIQGRYAQGAGLEGADRRGLAEQRIEAATDRLDPYMPPQWGALGVDKYGETFLVAEEIKLGMRRQYRRAVYAADGEPREMVITGTKEQVGE